MKKFLILLLALALPCQAIAWESTVGIGYSHRHFDSNDQLGAVSPDKKLSPVHSSGMSLCGSVLWDIRNSYRIGPEIWLSNGWLSVPHQTDYFTSTAGNIDTSDLTIPSAAIAIKLQVIEEGGHRLFLKPGFLVTNLSSGFFDKVDTDTGTFLGLELTSDFGKNRRFFVDVQAIFSPSTKGPLQFVVSPNLVLGVQWVFRDESGKRVSEPVKTEPPKGEAPKPIEPPKPLTPTDESESSKTPVADSVATKSSPKIQKVKGTLKLDDEGKLDAASYPLLNKVVEVSRQKPSIIVIIYKNAMSFKKLAEEIANYLISVGCPKEGVTLEPSDVTEKTITINIVPK